MVFKPLALFLMLVFAWYALRAWLDTGSGRVAHDGMLLVLVSTMFAIFYLIHRVIQQWNTAQFYSGRVMAYLLGYGISPLAGYFGSMAGGTYAAGIVHGLAKAVESVLGEASGFLIFILGIGAGMLIVTGIICFIMILLGLFMGNMMHRFILLMTTRLTFLSLSGSRMGASIVGYGTLGCVSLIPLGLCCFIFYGSLPAGDFFPRIMTSLLIQGNLRYLDMPLPLIMQGLLSFTIHGAFTDFEIVLVVIKYGIMTLASACLFSLCGAFCGFVLGGMAHTLAIRLLGFTKKRGFNL